jgi:hypothetical protein
MIEAPNSQSNIAAPDSLAIKLANFQCERMYCCFPEATNIQPHGTDGGAASDQSYSSSNYVEVWTRIRVKLRRLELMIPLFGSALSRAFLYEC